MPSNPHAQTHISAKEATGQLAMMLTNATDERLAGFTAEGLARMYRVRASDIEDMLERERNHRTISVLERGWGRAGT